MKYFYLITFAFLVGCGGGGDSSGGSSSNTFDGTWYIPCEFAVTTEIVVNGSTATVTDKEYSDSLCEGNVTDTYVTTDTLEYVGDIDLSDCYNGQKVNITSGFPVTVNETIFNSIEDVSNAGYDVSEYESETDYTLLCLSEDGTELYSGDYTLENQGTSDETRPTTAYLEYPIYKQ